MTVKPSKEQRYFDALKAISKFQSPETLKRRHWKDWGLDDPHEAIEYAYENVLELAKRSVKGHRRPKQ